MKFSNFIAIYLATTNSYSLILWINKGFSYYHELFIDSVESLMENFTIFNMVSIIQWKVKNELSAKMKFIEDGKWNLLSEHGICTHPFISVNHFKVTNINEIYKLR